MASLYQLGDDPEFERCLPVTLKEEGPVPADLTNPRNYSNDRGDPGGKTMDGITAREYDRWRIARGLPTRWVRNIDPVEVRTIYLEDYWHPLCPVVPAGIDLCLFDTNVNNGVHAGKVLLQRALMVTPDGIIGPETVTAIEAIAKDSVGIQIVIRRFYAARRAYYLSIHNPRFESDWLRRDLHIEQEALTMVPA